MASPTSANACSRPWMKKRATGIRTRSATTGSSWSSSRWQSREHPVLAPARVLRILEVVLRSAATLRAERSAGGDKSENECGGDVFHEDAFLNMSSCRSGGAHFAERTLRCRRLNG